jgi:hypothetical protein
MHDYYHVDLASKNLETISNTLLSRRVDHSEGLKFSAGELSSRAAMP